MGYVFIVLNAIETLSIESLLSIPFQNERIFERYKIFKRWKVQRNLLITVTLKRRCVGI